MNLAQLVNQNSYWLATLPIIVIAALIVLLRFRRSRLAWSAVAVLGAFALCGSFLLRVGVSEIESVAQFEQILAAPQPVVVEFYSNN